MERVGMTVARTEKVGAWSRGWALAGAGAWAGVAVLARLGVARLGVIELMFLFGPLVIVPLGMELGLSQQDVGNSSWRLDRLAQSLQPLGAILVVVAMCLPPGNRAGLLASGWLVVCGLSAIGGGIELWNGIADRSIRATRVAWAAGHLDLAVGGLWLVASRLGMRPLGIQEPIGLLTAVHFHFAGFATAMIAATTLQFGELRGDARWLRRVVLVVVVMPIVVAVGFVISPMVKMTAAVLFSCSVAVFAGMLWSVTKFLEDTTAKVFLRVAASAVLLGVGLSATYAVLDFVGSERLPIPRMASTHGVIQAVGFCLLGLLGWLIEGAAAPQRLKAG